MNIFNQNGNYYLLLHFGKKDKLKRGVCFELLLIYMDIDFGFELKLIYQFYFYMQYSQ